MLKKKSFAKITVCGLLFAGNRVILMDFLITKVAGCGNKQELLIYPCRMPWLRVGWSCKDLQGSCLAFALSLLVLTQLCPAWLCCSRGTGTWPMARAVGKLWLINGCKALLGLGRKGTKGTWSTGKEHNDVMFVYRRTQKVKFSFLKRSLFLPKNFTYGIAVVKGFVATQGQLLKGQKISVNLKPSPWLSCN